MRTYRLLGLIGTFIKLIGWLTVIGTLLSACGLLVAGVGGTFALPSVTGQNIPLGGLAAGALGPVIVSLGILVVGLVYGGLEIAAGELIGLMIDLSVNSQRSVQLLERLVQTPLQTQALLPAAPAAPGVPAQ
jgi:hypothetical protein